MYTGYYDHKRYHKDTALIVLFQNIYIPKLALGYLIVVL